MPIDAAVAPQAAGLRHLTLDEVAVRLGISKATIERWVANRDLDSFKKGGCRLVSEESLAKFVLLNTVKAKRPDWLTAAVETDFRNLLRGLIQERVDMTVWVIEKKFEAEARRRAEKKAA